ncbi:MAG: hypothetical protein GOVbin1782_17 [Prokaryotic dsDNA virus sp.]|nr:MAG: hypothetical protein GOVbin1782_17 [Prokaryotic dsDNA virus sp.]|tara:strand:- start:36 stop:314 length:279 start_codon:yes stop_codon:yes gene_type:complete
MNQREEAMMEEILRLERELSKYKWTEENPWWLLNYKFKVEFFWDENEKGVNAFNPKVRIHTHNPKKKQQIDKTLPLFTLAMRYAQKLLEEEE